MSAIGRVRMQRLEVLRDRRTGDRQARGEGVHGARSRAKALEGVRRTGLIERYARRKPNTATRCPNSVVYQFEIVSNIEQRLLSASSAVSLRVRKSSRMPVKCR